MNVRTGEFARERALQRGRDKGRDKAGDLNHGPSTRGSPRGAARVRARAYGRVAFELQRGSRAVWGFAVAAGFALLLGKGWFHDLASARGDGVRAAAAACLIAVLVAKIAGRLRMTERRRCSPI